MFQILINVNLNFESGYAQMAADWDASSDGKNVMIVKYEKKDFLKKLTKPPKSHRNSRFL